MCRAPGRFLLHQNHTVSNVLKVLEAIKVLSLSLELIREERQEFCCILQLWGEYSRYKVLVSLCESCSGSSFIN